MCKVKEIMKTDLITINENGSVRQAVRSLVDHNITGLPVVNDNNRLAGIISEKDMLKLLYNLEDSGGTVRDYMTRDPVSFSPEDSLTDVAECFINNHFRRVPIVSDGKLVGIVSRKDIVAYILNLRSKDK
jgi:CBS domain-containing protein